jgi:hypothetical protein
MMRNTWQWFALIAVPARTLAAQPVAVTNDATRTAQPVAKLLFGGFMEPAPPPSGGFGRRGPQRRWTPVGARHRPVGHQAPHRIAVPPSSMTVYEFEVR